MTGLVPASPGSHDTVTAPPEGFARTESGAAGAAATHGVATVPFDSVAHGKPLDPTNFETSTSPWMPLMCAVSVYCQRSATGAIVAPKCAIHNG